MLLNTLLCLTSLSVAVLPYLLVPTLSPWWIPLLLIGGYAAAALIELTAVWLYSCCIRKAADTPARRFFYHVVSHTAEWVVLLCGVRTKLENGERLPKDTPYLLVSNHLSNLDPLASMAVLRHTQMTYVSKPENFKIPVAAPIMRNAGFLPIDRENPRNAITTIKTAVKHITERRLCVTIYPEGTRNKSGQGLLPFHNGSFKIATSAKCPIVVCTLRYERASFPFKKTAILQVVEVLDDAYVAANRTDAISERAQQLIADALGL